jgi:F-type H+-transporting ATPase subunit delta
VLQAVAKRYARALFEIALERDLLERYDDQADVLEQVFAEKQIRMFFQSPRISAGMLELELLNLLKLLIDKRRILYVTPIMSYFNYLTNVHRGVEKVTLVSAVELSAAQRESIISELKRFSAYEKLRVETEVDRGVIGGVKVQLGDHLVVDGTVSSRLNDMRERLLSFMHRGTGA